MEIVVFGAGSLGSLIGGLLAREHDVTLVGREAHVEAVREKGLQIVGALELTVSPSAVADGDGLDADLAIVTVKTFDTEEAARQLATGRIDIALSLQNGMGNEAILSGALEEGTAILAGSTTYAGLLRSPGVVQCSGIGDVVVGPWQGGRSTAADRVAEAFEAADVECRVDADMPYRLWEKLAVNAGINPVTALARCRNGALATEPAADIARQAAVETAAVARSAGIDLVDDDAVSALDSVVEQTSANTSSMAYDVANDRPTEIDAINGYVVEHAPADLPVPINRTLASIVRTWERTHDIGVEFDLGVQR